MKDWPVVRWAKVHPFVVDLVLAAAIATVAIAVHFHQRSAELLEFRDPQWWTVLLLVATCVPLAWRRRNPIAVALVVVVLQGISEIVRVNGTVWIPILVVVYGLGAYTHGRRRVAATAAAFVLVALLLTGGLVDDVIGWAEVFASAAAVVLPLVVGDNVRRRRNELAELAARAERAERERELVAGQRVVEERTRIARELHDVVAHSVSAMVIQASAARRNLDRDPTATADLLGNIEDTGRRTMNELRQILGLLRDADADSPVLLEPSIGDLGMLVEAAPDLDVALSTRGAVGDVPSGVALSAFRVVQEALTNVRRHAGPHARVGVRVERNGDELDVLIEDDGRGASTISGHDDHPDGGYGLLGMGERVAAFGGTLRSGPRRSGGWQVHATLPLPADPTAPNVAGVSA